MIAEGDTLYPLEIKKHADLKASDLANFDVLDKMPGVRRGRAVSSACIIRW